MTNQGLQIEVPVAAIQGRNSPIVSESLCLVLDCCRMFNGKFFAITVELKNLGPSWYRHPCNELGLSAIVQDSTEGSETGAVVINIANPRSSSELFKFISASS